MSEKNQETYIVPGATGQVGSAVVDILLENNKAVRAIIRKPEKSDDIRNRGAEVEIADFHPQALKRAFSRVIRFFS